MILEIFFFLSHKVHEGPNFQIIFKHILTFNVYYPFLTLSRKFCYRLTGSPALKIVHEVIQQKANQIRIFLSFLRFLSNPFHEVRQNIRRLWRRVLKIMTKIKTGNTLTSQQSRRFSPKEKEFKHWSQNDKFAAHPYRYKPLQFLNEKTITLWFYF